MANMNVKVAVIAVAVLLGVATRVGAVNYLVEDLPGLPSPQTYKQYAGYITVDAAHNRRLFYWYQTAQHAPETAPLVLWLNGGPGCSSVGGGLMSENGAFFPNEDGTLSVSPWAWNRVANVVYLESPAGVGFSFSDDKADYTVGDNRTAHDSFTFLMNFLDTFPSLKGRDFWVTGESYGGHYVPDLAALIVQENKGQDKPILNLKGFMVGNPWTVAHDDNTGAVTDWYTHSLISEATYNGVLSTCNMSNIGPLAMEMRSAAEQGIEGASDSCSTWVSQAQTEMGNINIYDVYVDVCTSDSPKPGKLNVNTPNADDDPSSDNGNGGRIGYDPCISNAVTAYLNRLDVQRAIHAVEANATQAVQWTDCSAVLNYSRESLLSSMLPIYETLLQSNISILVYSGDVDAIVPTPGTKTWLKALDLTVAEPWRSWTGPDEQVGGYVTVFDRLTFTTIRNAGHMVPYMQPARAFHMFDKFLHGEAF